jgi:2,3-bisphosphoglycerate-independent phosphoglycerate mutase
LSGPVLLCVLDGFGIGDGGASDATALAHAPFLERTAATHPHSQLETSGEAVGLPPGQMGNSEVGHMTMGAGRVILQDLTRIGEAFRQGAMRENPRILETLDAVAASGGVLHLLGLVSDGGVHSHQQHLYEILRGCAARGIETAVHVFLDGRDTPPRSGQGFVRDLIPHVEAAGGHIATVMGRYWAMDRDNRWDRIQRALDAIVHRRGREEPNALEAIAMAYAREEGDEFVEPCVIQGGRALEEGDGVFFFNFRSDRARQLSNAITGACPERFEGQLDRAGVPATASFLCLTRYDRAFGLPEAFANDQPAKVLGEVVSEASLRQLRMAETEKYAHVTFFFNAGAEEPFPGEDRVLVPSPREVPTYDHRPEMSAQPLTKSILAKLSDGDYAFVLVNFANPDMVGHTGVLDAAVKAVETIDSCLEELTQAVLELEGQILITADHGNCEQMVDPETGDPHTAHTTNPVPLYWIRGPSTTPNPKTALANGGLADLAPTVLELIGLPIPPEMTGRSLLR